jgi:hypothetical protein
MSSKQATEKVVLVLDPLWNEVPMMGTEGVIATVENKGLYQKLREVKDHERAIIRG